MRRSYTPRAFAPIANNLFADHPRCALFGKPGIGKTLLGLTHLEHLHNVAGEDRPSLVLAPLRVARDGWAAEAAKWEHLAGFDVAPVVGTPSQREAALARDVPVYTTNYEQLPWLVERFGKRWPFGTVIADECTKLKGFRLRQGGMRATALARVAHKHTSRWINLSGTPSPNGLRDLWGQMWFVDAGARLGRTFGAFEDRWFGYERKGDYVGRVPFEWAQDEVNAALADVCRTIDPADWFDLTEPLVNEIPVTLPPRGRTLYREMEREYFTVVDKVGVEAVNAGAKASKCLQIASGGVIVDTKTGAWKPVHEEKLDALQELVESTGDDILLVVYTFRHEREMLRGRWPQAIDLSTPDGLARAKRGEGKIWLAQPQSVGHGVDGLQEHCWTVVFFAQDYNLEHHDQVIERVGPMRQFQAGHSDRVVQLHYLVAQNTLDQVAISRRATKRRVQDCLLEYMKGHDR